MYRPIGGEWKYHDYVCLSTPCKELERLCAECESEGCDACFWLAWCCGGGW